MKWITPLLVLVTLCGSAVAETETWSRVGRIQNAPTSNYTAFGQHTDGRVYFITNRVTDVINGVYHGEVVSQSVSSLWWPRARLSTSVNIVPEEDLAQYVDERGTPMTYSRTNAFASGGGCHVLLHVGAPYGTPVGYDYRPAYASSEDCVNWTYHGPVSVNDVYAPRIFSSNMGYVLRGETHYMLQDGAYGLGGLVLFSSVDGLNYYTASLDLTAVYGDAPVFPDMAYCKDAWHVVYEDGWGNGSTAVRHLRSTDLVTWELLDEDIPPSTYKGVNIGCVDGELYGVVGRDVWKWGTGRPPRCHPKKGCK